ncbi:MAG TPA: BON domain-containing protein [Gammaproteobacteria bacterium]
MGQPLIKLLMLPAAVAMLSSCAAPVLMGAAAAGTVVVSQDERSAGTIAADESIELKAAELAGSDALLAETSHLNFTSVNGVVLITGEAAQGEALARLQTAIGKLDKVREVRNAALTGPVSSMNSRSQDSWITTKVKSRMVAERNFRANRFKVVTERQTVYLMGVVTRHEGFVAGVIARDIEGVKRVVKMLEYLD